MIPFDHIPDYGELAAIILDREIETEASGLISDLEQARANVLQAAYWVAKAAEKVANLTLGSHVNSLGELQGSGPALDVAIAVFAERQARTISRLRKLGILTPDRLTF